MIVAMFFDDSAAFPALKRWAILTPSASRTHVVCHGDKVTFFRYLKMNDSCERNDESGFDWDKMYDDAEEGCCL